jgi:hypothetical protein
VGENERITGIPSSKGLGGGRGLPVAEVVNWNVVMGISQVVTLRPPASRVREVNRALEDTAWGAYRTEFFLVYDYNAVRLENRRD